MTPKSNKWISYIFLLMANMIPIVAVWQHRFSFFQVVYLYWLETVILIIPNCIRIGMAQGRQTDVSLRLNVSNESQNKIFTAWEKAGIMFRYGFAKLLIMLFYLIFIFLFLGLIVSGKGDYLSIFKSIFFRDPVFNAAVFGFVISMTVQLLAGYILNGKYRIMSPLNYNNILDGRMIILHIVIVLVTFMYTWWFEGKFYAAIGPVIYTSFFVFLKIILDLFSLKNEDYHVEQEAAVPYI